MAETSIKISLELADKVAQKALSDFIDRGDKAEKGLNKLKKSGDDTFKSFAVSIGKSLGVYDIFVGNLAANLAGKAIETLADAASSLFHVFVVDGVHAAAEAESSLNSLNVALKQSGIFSKSTSQEFQDFADEIQRTTAFEDDAIIKNAALIQTLGQLDKDGLKRATKAAVNLSAALDKDLSVTSEAVGKAATGNVTALQKMGFEFQKGRTDAETFSNALAAIEAKIGDAAASKVHTYNGAISQLSNNFGDLIKQFGNAVVQNENVVRVINEASKFVIKLTDEAKNQNSAFSKLVTGGLSLFLTGASSVVFITDIMVRGFQTLIGVLQVTNLTTALLALPLIAITKGFDAAATFAEFYGRTMIKNLTALGSSGDGALKLVSDGLAKIRDSANSTQEPLAAVDGAIGSIGTNLLGLKQIDKVGEGKMFNSVTGAIVPLEQAKGKIKELTDEMKRSQSELKSFALNLVKQGDSSKVAADTELETARAKAEQELIIQQDLLNKKEISELEYAQRKAEIEAGLEETRIAAEQEKYQADLDRLNQARAQQLVTETEYIEAKKRLDKDYALSQLKGDTDNKKRIVKTDKEIESINRAERERRLAEMAGLFGALGSLMATGGKKLFEISKAFNLAEAITAGILAVQKAHAALPYPANIPGIIAMTAASAANVIRITQTKAPSFATGGIVPGSSMSGDNVQANLNSREMVLNMGQQKRLFELANGGANSAVAIDYDRLGSAVARALSALPAPSIQIDGREVFTAVQTQIASGRSLA